MIEKLKVTSFREAYTERNLYWILREISLNLREISPCLRVK